jgi:MoaA/NifB/PqqE/SkfB family radical SAM enzyme
MYDVETLVSEPELFEPLRASVHDGATPAYLRSVKIKLTARCNLRCTMCRYGRGESPPELGTERFLAILEELADLGCRKVHFSGGEVLVRKDFELLVEHAARAGMKVALTSNLTLLGKDRARALLAAGPHSISTSLDGATPKTHDAIRGIAGSFKRTLAALDRLIALRKRSRPLFRVNFVMMRQNFREYPALVELAAAHGASDVVPMPVDARGSIRLSKRLIREYEAEVAPAVLAARRAAGMRLGERLVHPFGRSRQEISESALGRYAGGFYDKTPCYAPFLHLFIAWDGKVYLCCMTNARMPPLGDLSTQNVAEVFQGAPFQAIRKRMLGERLDSCHACDMVLEENRRLHEALGAGVERPVRRVLTVVG